MFMIIMYNYLFIIHNMNQPTLTHTVSLPAPQKYPPMIGAHIARNTQPPTQYLGKGRGYSTYYPMLF